ncbi:uncharacterized protein [Prorops nasuta]|uniref:uncharacterized protein n=1 Tax=Prorops nasuta TaxID=863751 RepID=UPI0034CEFD56
MIDGGLGETHLNSLLSAMNIPAVSDTTVKKYERLVGPAIEKVAVESCVESIRIEKALTLNALKDKDQMVENVILSDSTQERSEESDGTCKLIASYDAGWQKRGTGRSYNSLSGHGTLIGYYSGKIISYAIRCSSCRKCSLGYSKDSHDCRQNYQCSAKGMEPNMAIDLINNNVLFKQEGVTITTLIGDDDSSTISAVRRLSPHLITKWSDYNHTHKALTSCLYAIKLPFKLLQYFSHCFSHAVKQNKGNASKIEAALRSIVPHAYGDHVLCGDWCEGKTSPNQYVHQNLPSGKPLQDINLQFALTKIFTRYVENAEKIAYCASTQGNESTNSLIASKSPKARHYSGSESLSFRIAAAVCQKNLGCQYILNVLKKMQLHEGYEINKYRNQKDIKRKNKSISNRRILTKKRRLQLKKLRLSKTATSFRKEGITYESGVSFLNVSAAMPVMISQNNNRPFNDLNIFKTIVFDLETKGFSKSDEICQIAACTDETSFENYIISSRIISKQASLVTGLKMINGDLYYKEEKVEAFPARVAVIQFWDYLNSFKCPIILLAHNAFSFDMPRMLNLVFNLGLMDRFKFVVYGFTDSLIIFKKMLPERRKMKEKFSMEALIKEFLLNKNIENLHNAVTDVQLLLKLIHKVGITDNTVKMNTKTIDQIVQAKEIENAILLNKASLQQYKNKISQPIINKMAKVGINDHILQETFHKNDEQGIRILLQENFNDKPRVTTNNNIFKKICELFSNDK